MNKVVRRRTRPHILTGKEFAMNLTTHSGRFKVKRSGRIETEVLGKVVYSAEMLINFL